MTFERRNFIKTGTAGLAVGLVNPGLVRAQTSPATSSGEFEGGTGSVHLEGRLKAGVLKLEAHDFIDDRDRSLIIHGELNSVKLYCAMFSYNHDRTAFAILRDHDHSTTLVLSDTDDAKIGRLVVWNDAAAPQTFQIDKEKFMDTQNVKASVVDGKGDIPDLIGKRNPPDFTRQELEAVFGNNPALQEFMRGRRSTHRPSPSVKLFVWECDLLSGLPGSLFGPLWEAY